MKKLITPIAMDMASDEVREFALDSFVKEHPETSMDDLAKLGVTMDESVLTTATSHIAAMDAGPATQTAPSAVTPIQFAQFWLTNPIKILTRARTLDKVVGRTIVGTWETEQIVATILERLGQPGLYGDFTKAPLANWNVNFDTRDNVRFEMGVQVGKLEEARASQMRLNSYQLKREAMAEAFDILMNNVGWSGYTNGTNKLYGLLNQPNQNAVDSTILSGFSTASWANMITAIIAMVNARVTAMNGRYDPEVDSATWVIPTTIYQYLSKVNDFGISVRDYIAKTYPKIRIIAAPELVGAGNDGVNLSLFFVDKVDGDNTLQQMVTSTLRLVGAQPMAKGNYEVYSCSSAGALLRYPLAYQVYQIS